MKEKLLNILKDPKDKLIAIDLDGTLCVGEFWTKDGEVVPNEPLPIPEMIEKLWGWYKQGAHIIIFTARQPSYFEITNAWLIKHGVPFHGIVMQKKPGADVYIDDKALNINDVLYG